MTRICVREEIVIDRPVDEVKSHFFDIEHHALHPVHPGYRYVVLSRNEDSVTYNQIASGLLGGTDLFLTRRRPDGSLYTTCSSGPNAGLIVEFSFELTDASRAVCRAMFDLPVPRALVVLRPLIAWYLRRAVRQALQQDKKDLEAGAYSPAYAQA